MDRSEPPARRRLHDVLVAGTGLVVSSRQSISPQVSRFTVDGEPEQAIPPPPNGSRAAPRAGGVAPTC